MTWLKKNWSRSIGYAFWGYLAYLIVFRGGGISNYKSAFIGTFIILGGLLLIFVPMVKNSDAWEV